MQNQLENRAYAGFFVRFLAYSIDMMIASIAVGIAKLPFAIAASAGATVITKNFIFDYSLLDVIGYLGVAAYFVFITYYAKTTVGKMLFRLHVVCDKEWTFINVLYRETIGRFLSSLLCIGYLAVIVTEKKQGFHDMLCDTYVIYKGMCRETVVSQTVATLSDETMQNEEPTPDGIDVNEEVIIDENDGSKL